MAFKIEKASKKKLKARILLESVSGGGKTYSALILARNLGKKICVIDTEDNSASLYSELCEFDVIDFPKPYSPTNLIMAIEQLEEENYDVIVIDSLSAFWASTGGVLEIQTKMAKSKNSFQAWGDVTPLQNKLIDKILHCKSHIICTTRLKTDYVMEEYTDGSGKIKSKPVKVGLKTVQREGLDYEFTVVFRLDRQHFATADKSRTPIFDDFNDLITDDIAIRFKNWLNDGKEEIKNNDLKIFEEMSNIDNMNDLAKFFKDNYSKVVDKEKFITLKDMRKEALSGSED